AAQKVPQQVVPVGCDRRHHLRDDALGKQIRVQTHEVKSHVAEERAELLLVAAERWLEDETADLGGGRFVEVKTGNHVGGARLQALAEEAALFELEADVRVARAAHAADDLRRAEDAGAL